ncbi:MAG: invasion associated locus B family protein [Methylovirgula sp.]|uniref:invasion associated locus B family protein n=1 Tax=Methylovirgula sp. TaxID=1978224 RepID=UPI003075F515
MASPLMRLGVAGLTGFFLLAAAAQSSAQTQQAQGPIKLDLIGTQSKWTKVCGHDQAANRDVCYTTRDFSAQANQAPVIAVAVYDIKGDDTRIVRLLMPVGLMLRPGFRFWVDKGETLDGSFEICFPNGCFAESKIKGPTVDDMQKGTTLSIAVRNQANNEVTFAVPLAGFGDAFTGPAVDPKVLQAEQQKFQDELKKRAEEERKRLQASKAGGGSDASGGATGGASLGK